MYFYSNFSLTSQFWLSSLKYSWWINLAQMCRQLNLWHLWRLPPTSPSLRWLGLLLDGSKNHNNFWNWSIFVKLNSQKTLGHKIESTKWVANRVREVVTACIGWVTLCTSIILQPLPSPYGRSKSWTELPTGMSKPKFYAFTEDLKFRKRFWYD